MTTTFEVDQPATRRGQACDPSDAGASPTPAASASPRATARPGLPAASAAMALAAAWLWLYHPVLTWLAAIYPRDDFRINLLALVASMGLIAVKARSGGWRGAIERPVWRPMPLTLALGASCAFLVAERLLDVNILSAVLFGLGTYGLLGLWMPPRTWRSGWPAALLLVATLPFGAHMQVFVGLPVRLATAEVVARVLAAAGVAVTSADAVLTLERSVARVDLPCSGVQSLWTGGMFLLCATWLEGRRIGARWLAVALATGVLLLAGNAGRVLALVALGDVLGSPALARLAHVPLGVLAFAAACAAAAWLLRFVPGHAHAVDGLATVSGQEVTMPTSGRGAWTRRAPAGVGTSVGHPEATAARGEGRSARGLMALAGTVMVLALLYRPRPGTPAPQPLPDDLWPTTLSVTRDPLSPDEQAWLARDGAERAERIRFTWGDGDEVLSGSATVVASATWRAQHLPERCLEVYGLRLAGVRTAGMADDFPVRVVALGDPDLGQASRTAVYWFQSATRLTDDYAARIAADLSPAKERWVLVALLFDTDVDPASSAVTTLARALRASIATSLESPVHGGSS